MKKATLVLGHQASGKTTWINNFLSKYESQHIVRIDSDINLLNYNFKENINSPKIIVIENINLNFDFNYYKKILQQGLSFRKPYTNSITTIYPLLIMSSNVISQSDVKINKDFNKYFEIIQL